MLAVLASPSGGCSVPWGGPAGLTAVTTLKFTKMQGLGNDFVVFDGIRQRVELSRDELKRLADRRFGVGCDQVLVVEKASGPDADFRYRIWNADGGEVEQCGNGARCFVHFVRQQGLTTKNRIRVETAGGVIVPELVAGGDVAVDMGVPRFAPADIPFAGDGDAVIRRRSMSRARPFSSRSSRWAIRMPCRSSTTSTGRRSRRRGPGSSTTRGFRSA